MDWFCLTSWLLVLDCCALARVSIVFGFYRSPIRLGCPRHRIKNKNRSIRDISKSSSRWYFWCIPWPLSIKSQQKRLLKYRGHPYQAQSETSCSSDEPFTHVDEEFGKLLITEDAKEDYFPDAKGDAPRGNRLGGGGMTGSGTWAKNELDGPERPDTLPLGDWRKKKLSKTPQSDTTLSPMTEQEPDKATNTKSQLMEQPDNFNYDQFTGWFFFLEFFLLYFRSKIKVLHIG